MGNLFESVLSAMDAAETMARAPAVAGSDHLAAEQ
jgi:hypothetical protein